MVGEINFSSAFLIGGIMIKFDLNNKLEFQEFELMQYERNKNSPSAEVLRGKGSLFSAENFSYNDTFDLKLIVKDKKEDTKLNQLSKIKLLYAMYRTKGFVFLENTEIYNQVFPAEEIKDSYNMIKTILTSINQSEKVLSEKELSEFKKEAEVFLINIGAFKNEKHFYEIFPKPINTNVKQLFLEKKDGNNYYPILTCLNRISIKSLPDSSDGFEVVLRISVLKDNFNFDSKTIELYRKKVSEFSNFYNEIEQEILTYQSLNKNLLIKSVDYTAEKLYTTETQKTVNDEILKAGFDETIIELSNDDIAQLEFISYNQIADVPLQGQSTVLKQYLGVGQTHLSLKLLFKNQDDYNFKKLKALNIAISKEQRKLKSEINFPLINSFDFYSLEFSDFFYANDEQTNGVYATLILKLSGYRNGTFLVNSDGEKVNETIINSNKTKTANLSTYYSAYANFNYNLIFENVNDTMKLVIDTSEDRKYTYEDLTKAYYNGDQLMLLVLEYTKKKAKFELYNEVSNIDLLNYLNSASINKETRYTQFLDVMGIGSYLEFLNMFGFCYLKKNDFDLLLKESFDFTGAYDKFISKSLYEESFYYIASSMFPNAAYQQDSYFHIETLKLLLVEALVRVKGFIIEQYKDLKLDNVYQIDSIENKLKIGNKIVSAVYKQISKILISEEFMQKCISSFNLNKTVQKNSFSPDAELLTIEQITKKVSESILKIKIETDKYNTSEFSNTIQNIVWQCISINSLRTLQCKYDYDYERTSKSHKATVPDKPDSDEEQIKKLEQGKIVQEAIYYFNFIDFVNVCSLSFLNSSYGMANSYYGFINDRAGKQIVNNGIKARSLLISAGKENEKEMNYLLQSLFGNSFISTTGADTFYNPLTSNISLTDLGSYFGKYTKDNSGEFKVIFNYLLNKIDSESPSFLAKKQYFDLLKKTASSFLEENNEISKSLECLYAQLKENPDDKEKQKEIEKIQNAYNDSLLGNNVINNLYDTSYNNKINFSQNFNSADLRTKRIESMLLPFNNIQEMSKTLSPNFNYSLPTYDIYVLQKELFYNASTYGTTERIENFLGLDKLISLSVGFTELTKTKTATLRFLDCSESINSYDFDLNDNTNEAFHSLDEYTKKHEETDFFKVKRQQIKIGDCISIHMGYMNENKVIFNGVITSIQEGKIKTLVCTNFTYEITSKTFDLNLSYNNGIVDLIGTMKRITRARFENNFNKFKNAKKNSLNINNHFIFDNFYNKNFNELYLTDEKLSNYNLIFFGLSNVLKEMKHFTGSNNMKLAKMKQNAKQWYDFSFFEDFPFAATKESVSNDLIININNIDRDASYYGIRIKAKKLKEAESDYAQNNQAATGNGYLEAPASSFILQGTLTKDVRYQRDNITMHDLLNDIEKRSPGTFWNVYDSGFTNSLFVGRKGYNIKLKDCKSEFEFNKSDATMFIEYYETQKDKIINFSFLNKFAFLKNLIAMIIGEQQPENSLDLIQGSNFDEDYEKASNIIYATTNKNLIANNIMVNGEVPNKIKFKYDPTLLKRLGNLSLDFSLKSVELYAFAGLMDTEDEEGFEDRIKEKLIEDENIRDSSQAIESSQSRLQIELEGYYQGKIIILFNPDIQYRTELVMHDSTNQIYGSVLVKDFEHKFDQRGSYTIITPMMKIEPLNMAKDTFATSFWTRLFYDKNSEKTEANEKFNSFRSYLKENNDNSMVLFNMIINKTAQIPIVFGNTAYDLNDKEKKFTDLKTAGIQPLCFYPLLKRKDYLLPDLDIYNLQQRKYFEGLTNWFIKLKSKTVSLFSLQKNYINTFDANLLDKTWAYLRNRYFNLFQPEKAYIQKLNMHSILGSLYGNEIDKFIFESVKKIMLRDLNNIYLQDKLPISKFAGKLSFGFYNTKIFSLLSKEEKKRNIATIISNFDCISLVELADVLPTGKKGGIPAIKQLANELLEILKENNLNYKITEPILIRKDAMTIEEEEIETQADEYSVTFYREQNKNLLTHFNLQEAGNKQISFPVKQSSNNELKDRYITINVPKLNIKIFRENKTYEFSIYVFHNIYFAQSLHLTAYRAAARRESIRLLLETISKDKKPSMIFGDFNISMFRYSPNSNKVFQPVLGEVLQLDEIGDSNLTAKANGFYPLIAPSTLTTLGTKADKNSFENILINDNFDKIYNAKKFQVNYGIFYEAKLENNIKTREVLSDHYPSYFNFLK